MGSGRPDRPACRKGCSGSATIARSLINNNRFWQRGRANSFGRTGWCFTTSKPIIQRHMAREKQGRASRAKATDRGAALKSWDDAGFGWFGRNAKLPAGKTVLEGLWTRSAVALTTVQAIFHDWLTEVLCREDFAAADVATCGHDKRDEAVDSGGAGRPSTLSARCSSGNRDGRTRDNVPAAVGVFI